MNLSYKVLLNCTAACLIVFMTSCPAWGSVLSFNFSGVVDPQANAGSHFFGTIVYDPLEATAIPTDNAPYTATYDLGPSSTLTVQVDSQSERVDLGSVTMRVAGFPADKGFGTDSTVVEIWGKPDQNGLGSYLALSSYGTLLYPSLLPPGSLNLSDFTSAVFAVGNRSNGAQPWSGRLTSLGATSSTTGSDANVPEPSSTSTICIAVAALIAFRRHRGRTRNIR